MILAFNPRLKYIDIPDATDTAYPVGELDRKMSPHFEHRET